MTTRRRGLRTRVVHAGEERLNGAVAAPIFRSSTYELGEPESFDDIRYIRLNNTPSQRAVELKLGALEGGDAMVTPSGTAAVWLALAHAAGPGAHVLAPTRIYGGTRKILDLLAAREGLEVRYVDLERPQTWAAARTERTRAFFVESIANPWMSVAPLDEVASFCRAEGLTSIVDHTLATPVLSRPLELGFDLVVHSASKHLNGHSDVVAGVIAGEATTIREIRVLANRYGVCPDPEACALLARGLKTLPLRVEAQSASALVLARALDAHEGVEKVWYAGLPDDPSHARAKQLFASFGTLLSFRARGGAERAKRLVRALELPIEAPSLGGVETLVTRPATTTHAGLSAELRASMGIDDAMIRVSVGVEDAADLVADFEHALRRSAVHAA
ncbi:MAG: PLP-dependent transferase [Sandaracinus sp.]|nr:PLP-dependent transferase [Sandaracinus sp.]